MLKDLIEYIKEGQSDSKIDNYLDSKYIHLTDAHYDQIANAISQGELSQKKVSCCMAEIEKTCCPETKDNSCASETELFHFDFETLVTSSNINFSIVSVMDVFLTISSSNYINLKVVKYLSGIPPPKLKKPVLSQIQSFLL